MAAAGQRQYCYIVTPYGDELVITLTGTERTRLERHSGSQITVVADGHTSTYSLPAGGVFVSRWTYHVGSGVTVWTTLETIDGVATTISR